MRKTGTFAFATDVLPENEDPRPPLGRGDDGKRLVHLQAFLDRGGDLRIAFLERMDV
jgi:hypothetical protein